jgi:sulfur carrier protein
MNIFINGDRFSVEHTEAFVHHALALFLSEEQQDTTFAVALNSDFIGRGDYHNTIIKEGDSIDVLFPIQGG